MLLDARDVQPVHRVQDEDALDQVLALLAQVKRGRERVLHAADPHDRLPEVPGIRRVLERVPPDHHDVQRDPARPHVRGFTVVRLAGQHLGGDVRGGTHRGLGLRVDERVLRVAKVANLQPGNLPAVQEGVLELQVAVRHAVRVAVLQPADELLEEEPGLVLVEPPFAADAVEQLAPSRVLHDDREVRGREEHLDEADDVRVVQQAVIDQLALDVLVDLFPALDVLDGEELPARPVPHQLGGAEVALAEGLDVQRLVLGIVRAGGDGRGGHGLRRAIRAPT